MGLQKMTLVPQMYTTMLMTYLDDNKIPYTLIRRQEMLPEELNPPKKIEFDGYLHRYVAFIADESVDIKKITQQIGLTAKSG